MEIRNVGVVGCGQMGAGIVQVCAQGGYEVTVSEINDEYLAKGLGGIEKQLVRSVEKGKRSEESKNLILGRIHGTTDMNNFSGCQLVIEAAVENLDLKKKIFSQLDSICPPETVLASNTSCLSVIDVAMSTSRPDKVLGLHFFNPVPMMKLLEIVKTITTSDETLKAGVEFGKSLEKQPVVTQDAPGFIVNRLLLPLIVNAIEMLESGVASAEDIDTSLMLGANHPMGPLALADLIGLDTVLFIVDAIYSEFKDNRYRAPVLLRKMVKAGWLGRKTGKGFYSY